MNILWLLRDTGHTHTYTKTFVFLSWTFHWLLLFLYFLPPDLDRNLSTFSLKHNLVCLLSRFLKGPLVVPHSEGDFSFYCPSGNIWSHNVSKTWPAHIFLYIVVDTFLLVINIVKGYRDIQSSELERSIMCD